MKTDITIRSVDSSQKKQWDTIANHPLQSWQWGEFREKMGIHVARIGKYKGVTLTDGWQVTFHTIPHTPYTVGYFPKGSKPTADMLRALQDIGRTYNAIYIQLEPDCQEKDTTIEVSDKFKPSHRPMFTKHTFMLDCTKTESELLSSMHSKTRYNVGLARKRGVTVQEDNSPGAYNEYERLSDETTARQGFYAHNHTYHRTLWSLLYKAGIAHIFTAVYNRQTLAAWMVFSWKQRLYYPYGASSREHREVMAPSLLLWEIVRWAKAHGCTEFDLWGALGPNPDTQDPWYGFHKFKQGYNPELVTYVGSFDLVIRPFLYRIFILADTVRWVILNKKP